mmetsp:Transcript_37201/g.107138  ORF Transcript_37201/g.107138 Transcript_37201/m.107138 type:complete len:264 (+) Transcript_37201:660-1451(+)
MAVAELGHGPVDPGVAGPLPAIQFKAVCDRCGRLQRALQRDAVDQVVYLLWPRDRDDSPVRHASGSRGGHSSGVSTSGRQVREKVEGHVWRHAQELLLRRSLLPLLRKRVQWQDLRPAASARGFEQEDVARLSYGRRRVELVLRAGDLGDLRQDDRRRRVRSLRPGADGCLPGGVPWALLLELDRAAGFDRVELPARIREGLLLGPPAPDAGLERPRRRSVGEVLQPGAVPRFAHLLRREGLPSRILWPLRRRLGPLRQCAMA